MIGNGKVVSIHYTLSDGGGKVLDSSEGEEPMEYLHGAGNIVPGLEKALEGKKAKDSLKAVVSPEDGYGEREDGEPQAVPREAFPADADLEVGMEIAAEDDDGDLTPLWIVGVSKDHVMVDKNHPLAGETLHFAVEVVSVRDATPDEIEHGHPHTPGHHHHH